MHIKFCKYSLSLLIFSNLPTNFLVAQSNTSGSLFNVALIVIAALVFITAVYIVTENLIGIEAQKIGVSDLSSDRNFFSRLFQKKVQDYVVGSYIHLKKGHDILLMGKATKTLTKGQGTTFAIQPPNFVGMSPIPKLTVEVGNEVLAGEEIFFDKKRPNIKYVSPVSGELVAVNRGAKRAIKEVVILADKEQKYRELPTIDVGTISREDLVAFLLDNGAWTLLRQRPYDIVPDPDTVPDNIFVSTFDTAPLAPDLDFIIEGNGEAFQKGIDLLSRLTDGEVHLGLNGNGKKAPNAIFRQVEGAASHWFSGQHPAGNVGVQIHHIKPVSNGKEAWILGVQDVITFGKLVTDRRFDATRIIALTGQSLANPHYIETKLGAKVSDLLKGEKITDDHRIISGDILSGSEKEHEGFLDFKDDQITVVPEGRDFELFGWLLPFKMRPSISRTFSGFLFKDKEFQVTTNTHGEERAFVMTGQYEKMLPMDIYPQHLMKAIITKDFEKMEGLGIYELSEEDVALCEFACTSKQPLQHILRAGLNLMREQG